MSIEDYMTGKGEFKDAWRAFVDARLQAAVDEKEAELEAEDEQRILYGTGDPAKMPQGVIYLDAKRRKE